MWGAVGAVAVGLAWSVHARRHGLQTTCGFLRQVFQRAKLDPAARKAFDGAAAHVGLPPFAWDADLEA